MSRHVGFALGEV